MIIAPLVLAVLVMGVAKVGDFKAVGRIGGKTIVYFTFATLLALSLGLVIVNLFEPGKVMALDLPPATADAGASAGAGAVAGVALALAPASGVHLAAERARFRAIDRGRVRYRSLACSGWSH